MGSTHAGAARSASAPRGHRRPAAALPRRAGAPARRRGDHGQLAGPRRPRRRHLCPGPQGPLAPGQPGHPRRRLRRRPPGRPDQRRARARPQPGRGDRRRGAPRQRAGRVRGLPAPRLRRGRPGRRRPRAWSAPRWPGSPSARSPPWLRWWPSTGWCSASSRCRPLPPRPSATSSSPPGVRSLLQLRPRPAGRARRRRGAPASTSPWSCRSSASTSTVAAERTPGRVTPPARGCPHERPRRRAEPPQRPGRPARARRAAHRRDRQERPRLRRGAAPGRGRAGQHLQPGRGLRRRQQVPRRHHRRLARSSAGSPGSRHGELVPALYVHYEDRAVQHLFSVACGLDSMVVGEAQILGPAPQPPTPWRRPRAPPGGCCTSCSSPRCGSASGRTPTPASTRPARRW